MSLTMNKKIATIISQHVERLYGVDVDIEVNKPDRQFGDFSTNVALKISKLIKRSPLEIAEELKTDLLDISDIEFQSIYVAKPGFLNFILKDNALIQDNEFDFSNPKLASKQIVIETNNPNPFKAMHIGHALNAILGDTIANLLEQGGGIVHRVSYHGDVGSHVGKSMWAILKYLDNDPEKLSLISSTDRSKFLADMYVRGAEAYENDLIAKNQIIELAQQSYDFKQENIRKIYQTCKDWSFDELANILDVLGSKPVEKKYMESQVVETGMKIVEDNIEKCFEKSDGAIIFKGEKYGLYTCVFVNSLGKGIYATRDLGLIESKKKDFSPDISYIVTAIEQKDYFKLIIKVSDLCQISSSTEMINITTGVVKLPSGKMSSRTGKVVDINWLINVITKELENYDKNVSKDLIVAAIRYQFLKVRVGNDIVFDVKQSVSLQGNSGPYLIYAHARARSILAKIKSTDYLRLNKDVVFENSERILITKINEFNDVMSLTIEELKPHHLCNYLYELSQEFNRFYEKTNVIGSERQSIRLKLVELYADVLKKGLFVLGINALDKI